MRVVAGKYKRRLLKTVPGIDVTRPTSDRVKESLFNILGNKLQETIVLDLFSGSGALGIEALSRGAAHVVFVDSHSAAIASLRDNLKNIGVPSTDYTVIQMDVDKFLTDSCAAFFSARKSTSSNAEQFAASISFVFADPPYASNWYNQALRSIENSGLCNNSCTLVVEMEAKREPLPDSESWTKNDERVYGKTRIEFWTRETRGEVCKHGNGLGSFPS